MSVGRLLFDAKMKVAGRCNLALALLLPFLALFFLAYRSARPGETEIKAKQRQRMALDDLNKGRRQGRICESSYTVPGSLHSR